MAEAHLWILWHKSPNPSKWLKIVIENLQHRQASGQQLTFNTHRLCDIVMGIQDGKPEIYVEGQIVERQMLPHVAYLYIPCTNDSFSSRLHPVVLHLETLGVRCVNSSEGFNNASSKFKQMCVLANHGIPMPDTITTPCYVRASVPSILQVPDLVRFPAILKHVSGMQGKRVMLIQNEQTARDLCENLYDDHMYVMQEYMAESHGRHVRAFVTGGNVLGFKRYINKSTKRVQSNYHQGGERDVITKSDDCKQLALKIAKLLHLDITAIDFLEDKEGNLYFIEANSSPSMTFQGVGADAIIEHLLSCCTLK